MVVSKTFEIRSPGRPDPMLITGQIERLVRSSGLVTGLVGVFVPGTGISLLTAECPGGSLEGVEALIAGLLRISDNPELLSNLTRTAGTFPFLRGQLQRSTWQELLLVDFVPEERWHHVSVQMIGA